MHNGNTIHLFPLKRLHGQRYKGGGGNLMLLFNFSFFWVLFTHWYYYQAVLRWNYCNTLCVLVLGFNIALNLSFQMSFLFLLIIKMSNPSSLNYKHHIGYTLDSVWHQTKIKEAQYIWKIKKKQLKSGTKLKFNW